MQRSQRAEFNHALNLAVELANRRSSSVLAYFGIMESYPGANLRHFRFMVEGLAETVRRLADRRVGMVARREDPCRGIVALAEETGASAVVADVGYLPHHRRWRRLAAEALPVQMVAVETDAIVPVGLVSGKEEYAARTIRPKINRLLPVFLKRPQEPAPKTGSHPHGLPGQDLLDPAPLLEGLKIDRSVPPSPLIRGGRSQALRRLEDFLDRDLHRYHKSARDPVADATSRLSPYLHFGQISPLEVALKVGARSGPGPEAFLEQLVVRRELALNMTFHNGSFRRIGCLPDWARRTLELHADDRRQYVYDLQSLEEASTHDPYWNAAQMEMVSSGRMHNYMRMYWGKKILEWSPSPAEALRRINLLNDRWELDGRDPSGYAGALWCLGKHDRAWKERPVVGKVRWMSSAGLERKFDMAAYVEKVDALASGAAPDDTSDGGAD